MVTKVVLYFPAYSFTWKNCSSKASRSSAVVSAASAILNSLDMLLFWGLVSLPPSSRFFCSANSARFKQFFLPHHIGRLWQSFEHQFIVLPLMVLVLAFSGL